jgi:hypothetical protein
MQIEYDDQVKRGTFIIITPPYDVKPKQENGCIKSRKIQMNQSVDSKSDG